MRCSRRSIGFSLAIATLLSSGCSEPPPDSGIPIDPRIEEIRGVLRNGEFDEGRDRAQALVAEARTAHGARSIQVARALDLVAEYYWRSQQAAAAEALDTAEQAVRLKRDLGASKAEIANSLRNVAKLAEGRGERARAEDLYRTMVDLRRKALGRDSSEVALAMFDLAQLYQTSGQQRKAAPLYERVLEIQTRRPDDPWIAYTLNNLAIVRYDLGEYDESRALYERALALKEEKAQDCPGRLNVAWTLNALALLLVEMGNYDEAGSLYERALSIRRECLGGDHPYVALVLVNLAALERLRGDYVGARRSFEEALRIEEKSYGREHLQVMETQSNLARLCFDMGDYSEAKRLYGEAVSFWERAPNPDPRWTADALQGLASTLTESGEYARARELQERALSMREASTGKRDALYALALDRYAALLERMGDPVSAVDLRSRALSIHREALGGEHPGLVPKLSALAELQLRSGRATEALALLDQALAVSEASLGPEHPDVAEVLRVRGLALAATGDERAALESALRAEEIGRRHLELTARFLPERQALRYASVRSSGLDLALSLVAGRSDAEAVRKVWESLGRSRALVLDEMAARRRATREASDPAAADAARELAARSRRLANLWIRGVGELDPQRYRSLLDSATRAVEESQRQLAEASETARQDRRGEPPGLAAIAAALPPRTSLVAFAHYDRSDLTAGRPVPSYLAFVLADARSEPVVVSLGPAAEVDRQVERWGEEAARGVLVAGRSARDAENAYRTVGTALRRTVWDPIASRLGDPERIFVVPDGALNLVNLASLPADAETYLIESEPPIHYLSAERDLVLADVGHAGGEGLLAIGGPDFDERPGVAHTAAPARETGAVAVRGDRVACGDLRGVRFEPLAAASSETEEVVRMWTQANPKSPAGDTGARAGALFLTRGDASEAAFKARAPGRRVIHLATHGFFLGGACSPTLTATRGIEGLRPESGGAAAPRSIEDPLLLSGLALAGANHRDEAELDEENGILTAAEIAAMDLTGVEWAVLSACDTGIGEVQAGEGVFGLRRAFRIAGARTTIMSLWAVDDEFARRWMVELYRGRLSERRATDEAVRRATLQLLQQARASGTSHPYYWAGFVATGDWR